MKYHTRIMARVGEVFKPRHTRDSQNAWNLYGDIAWFGILSGITQAFLSVYTLRVGGSDMHVGLLSALPALITIFVSIPGSRLVEREKRPPSILVFTALLNRIGYLAIALVPSFLMTNRADAIVVFVALLTIPTAVANVAFANMFAQAVKPDQRAHVVSVRNVLIGITSTLAAFVGGKFLEYVPLPYNYQILFAIGFAGSLLSAYYLARIRLPALPHLTRSAAVSTSTRDFVGLLRANDKFARFVFASTIFQWGIFFPLPLYSIYWVRNLNATDGWIGFVNTIGIGLTVFFYPLWARVAMRSGNRPLLLWSTFGSVLYPFFTALIPSIEWMIAVSFVAGIFNPAYGLSSFNGLLEVAPEQNRSSYIAIYNTLVNVAAFAGPIISTTLTPIFGIREMLMVGAALRVLGAFLFWQQRVLVKESVASSQ